MQKQRFEHHIALRQNKLCPFKIEVQDRKPSPCNWHRNIEILMIARGEGRMQYDAQEFVVEEHDIVAVNPNSLHHVYSSGDMKLYCIIIDENFCADNGIDTDNIRFEKHFKDTATESLCITAAESYAAHKNAPSEISAARLRRDVLSLLVNLLENHSCQGPDKEKEQCGPEKYIKKTISYLSEHFTEAVSLEVIADNCGITRHHLAREFKRYTGKTVFGYLNILRCRHAEFCLSQGMTITEAARESGFNTLSYFSRTYKKIMGCGPSSSRKK